MHDCNPSIWIAKDPTDDPCIPMEYKNAYEHFSFHLLYQNVKHFCMLLHGNVEEIFLTWKKSLVVVFWKLKIVTILQVSLQWILYPHVSMRKRMATKAKLPTVPFSETLLEFEKNWKQTVMKKQRKERWCLMY